MFLAVYYVIKLTEDGKVAVIRLDLGFDEGCLMNAECNAKWNERGSVLKEDRVFSGPVLIQWNYTSSKQQRSPANEIISDLI